MIRYGYAGVWVGTSEDYVASLLPIHDEPNPLEHLDKLLAGNVRGQLH
jgi:hypothetical protein